MTVSPAGRNEGGCLPLPFCHQWRKQRVTPVLKRELRLRICTRCGKVKGLSRRVIA